MKNVIKCFILFICIVSNAIVSCPLCIGFSKEDKRPFFEQPLTKTSAFAKATADRSSSTKAMFNTQDQKAGIKSKQKNQEKKS